MQIGNLLLLQITMPCIWCLLLAAIIPFLLGLLLGSLLWRRRTSASADAVATGTAGAVHDRDAAIHRASDLEKELMDLRYRLEEAEKGLHLAKDKVAHAEADTAGWRAKFEVLDAKIKAEGGLIAGDGRTVSESDALVADLRLKLADCESKYAALLAQSGATSRGGVDYAALFTSDNLQIVEGIGPKVSELLVANGIVTWADLAAKQPEELAAILEGAGPAYRMMDPTTWPRQAQLAQEGQWEELVTYQQFLDSGRDNVGDASSPAKISQMALGILGFANNPEDLKIVEGIGPKIEELLKAAGINNWADLAATSTERIQEILNEAGERFRLANPATWPRQAELANAGQWQELKAYQDFLNAGNDPA